jgi:L-amino acid N-acyltransferase YncA
MTESKVAEDICIATLPDGASVSLRRLRSGDIDAVIALHANLTDREVYLRFFTMHPVVLKRLADKLTDDDDGNYALGAFESGTLIGVANYVMCGKPATADVAIVVAHDDHLRGVGTALLVRLAQVARHNGVQHLVADVLASNHLMFKVLHDAGLRPQTKTYKSGVVHLDIDLATVKLENASAEG